MTKEEAQREIELKLNACLPQRLTMAPSVEQEKQQTINNYYNQVNDLYFNKNSKAPFSALKDYNALTELDKMGCINQNVFVDDMVMVLVEKPGTGQKFSLLTRLVFNDFVKYRDYDFYEKYHLLFDL